MSIYHDRWHYRTHSHLPFEWVKRGAPDYPVMSSISSDLFEDRQSPLAIPVTVLCSSQSPQVSKSAGDPTLTILSRVFLFHHRVNRLSFAISFGQSDHAKVNRIQSTPSFRLDCYKGCDAISMSMPIDCQTPPARSARFDGLSRRRGNINAKAASQIHRVA